VGARAVVMKDVEPWTVVAGNPSQFIKHRELRQSPAPPPELSEGVP
jgi:acetyltransferase-like isoleucine patch superfamily enzyme